MRALLRSYGDRDTVTVSPGYMLAFKQGRGYYTKPGAGGAQRPRTPSDPLGQTPQSAIDQIIGPNPKIFKLAEGFQFTEGPI